MSIWQYKSSVNEDISGLAGKGFTRRVVFTGVPVNQVEGLLPAEYTPYPGESGKRAAVLMKRDVKFQDRVGKTPAKARARVTLFYRPLTFDEWLEANPNHAVLFARTGSYSERILAAPTAAGPFDDNFLSPLLGLLSVQDANQPNFLGVTGTASDGEDKIIEGPDAEAGTTWVVTSGSNTITKYRQIYEVYAVVNDLDAHYFPFASKVGRYNEFALEGFPLAPESSKPAQWRLVGMSKEPRPAKERLWTCRYQFMFDDEGWDRPIISTEFRCEPVEEVVSRVEPDAPEKTKTVTKQVPTGNVRSVQKWFPENFFGIDAMFIDSWEDD